MFKNLPFYLLLAGVCATALAYDTLPNNNPFPNADAAKEAIAPWVEIDEGAPSITLRFLFAGDFNIYRRVYGETSWGDPLVASTGTGASSWTDTNVTPGVIYEYGVHDATTAFTSSGIYGYVTAGIRVDQAEPRGTVILVVARNVFEGNDARLKRLTQDLVGDGWNVRTVTTTSYHTNIWAWDGWGGEELHGHDGIQDVRRKIQSIYHENPEETKLIYILGHAPFPMTGTSVAHPDGHGSRGPYVTDFYYADVDGLWTDIQTSSSSVSGDNNDDALSLPNVPGDGLFDPNHMPSKLEMGVGRMDPFMLSRGDDATLAGIYLDKTHAYRHDAPYGMAGSEVRPGDRAIQRYNPGGQEGAVSTGLQFMALFGPDKVDDFVALDNLPSAIAPNTDPDVQYIVDNGPYLYYGANSGPPPGTDFGSTAPHRYSMQSWWGDWWAFDSSRNDLTNPDNQSLTWIYTGRYDTQHMLHPLGIGAPFGEALKISFNFEFYEYLNGEDPAEQFGLNTTEREFVHSFVGDPTLRLFPAPPVQDLSATPSGGNISLNWSAPHDVTHLEEYRIYRASDIMGEFTEIARGVTGTSYIDAGAPNSPKTYMVQAVHLKETGSGSFLNNSQGQFASVGLTIETGLLPPFPIGEDVDYALEVSGQTGTPQWSLASGSLPQGMTLSTDGRLQGNPVVGGMFEIELEVRDGAGVPVRRKFSLLVNAAFTEMMNLDLRSDGSGLSERTQYKRNYSFWGDPEFAPDGGMVFDGDDAVQIHDLATNDYPYLRYFPFNGGDGFTFAMAFKADPNSNGGVLASKAYNLNGSWGDNLTYYAIRLRTDGKVDAWAATRRITSSRTYNDGQWHYVIYTERQDSAETALYIDGQLIGTSSDGRKFVDHDFLIGARWADETAQDIAEGFNGTIADVRGYLSGVTDGEAKALSARFANNRADLNQQVPIISGLPSTIFVDRSSGSNMVEQEFQITDPNGDPIKPVLLPANFLDFEALQVDATADGYILRAQLPDDFSGSIGLVVGADDQWPGPLVHQNIHILVPGAADDQFSMPVNGGVIDVLSNDVVQPGSTIAISQVVTQPAQGYVAIENGKLVFYPPSIWSVPLFFEYEVTISPSGETSIARVDLIPNNLPQAVNDLFANTGSAQLLDVAANDSDPFGEMLTLVRVDQPTFGSTRIISGQVQYTPPVGGTFGNIDTFTYYMQNESGFMTAAEVTITPNALSGPLVELLFGDGSGSIATNTGTLGATANATLQGSPSWSTRDSGGAITLNGSSDFLSLGNPSQLQFNPATDSFSVIMAVKPTNHANLDQRTHTLISKMDENTPNGPLSIATFLVDYGSSFDTSGRDWYNYLRAYVGATFDDTNFGLDRVPYEYQKPSRWRLIDDNLNRKNEDWRLISYLYNAQTKVLDVYVDHWLVIRTKYSGGSLPDNGLAWLIGAEHNGAGGYEHFLEASIDNVRIYDRALLPFELKPMLEELDSPSSNIAPTVYYTLASPAPNTNLKVGQAYTFRLGYEDPDSSASELIFTAQLRTPSGSYIDFETAEFTYTPQSTGSLSINYTVTQNDGTGFTNFTESVYYSVTVTGSVSSLLALSTEANLPSVEAQSAVSVDIDASGGSTPYSFSSANLPTGLSLNASSGVITGELNTPGNYVFTVAVTDNSNKTVSKYFLLPVRPVDSDNDGLADAWEMEQYGNLNTSAGDDLDLDNMPAELEFVLGRNANQPDTEGVSLWPTKSIGGGSGQWEIAMRYPRRRDIGDWQLKIMRSNNLLQWSEVIGQSSVLSDDGEYQIIEVRLPLEADTSYFYRLEVVAAP